MRLLDLFCGAGGAGMGYHRTGFEVVGVDINPQKHYPFPFILGDAIDVLTRMLTGEKFLASDGNWYGIDDFDAIHASPPCQDWTRSYTPIDHGTGWLLPAVREQLIKSGKPWIIENVPGAEMRADFRLCGCMFGLPRLRRERWFETSWNGFSLLPACQHIDPVITVAGHGIPSGSWYLGKIGGHEYGKLARQAMGIDWMTRDELAQAIPPAYTEFIGRQLMTYLEVKQ
jgi:DNA (cytosine-5)-methyltransferase 1